MNLAVSLEEKQQRRLVAGDWTSQMAQSEAVEMCYALAAQQDQVPHTAVEGGDCQLLLGSQQQLHSVLQIKWSPEVLNSGVTV